MVKEKREDVSLYIHIPFCSKKCHYCHFYVIPNKTSFHDLFLKGFHLEWQQQVEKLRNKRIVSLYFGGGTPSLLGPDNFSTLLDRITSDFPNLLNGDCEITLEANPEDITYAKMKAYREVGINRLSIGIQSLENPLLKLLGRQHSAEKALFAVEECYRAGFDNISVDAIYDLPYQTEEQWQRTIKQLTTLPITHLSLYNLTIEPHTSFYKRIDRLTPHLPSEEASSRMYTFAMDFLPQQGFEQYEISAFCKASRSSHHNIGYWSYRPFLGFGPSAYSHWEGKRFRNIPNINRYYSFLKEGRSIIDFEEELPIPAQAQEELVIGLRLLQGISLDALHHPIDQSTQEKIKKLIDEGLLQWKGKLLSLTRRGTLFYDHLASELI